MVGVLQSVIDYCLQNTTTIFINYFFCHWLYSVGVRTLTIEKTNFQQ